MAEWSKERTAQPIVFLYTRKGRIEGVSVTSWRRIGGFPVRPWWREFSDVLAAALVCSGWAESGSGRLRRNVEASPARIINLSACGLLRGSLLSVPRSFGEDGSAPSTAAPSDAGLRRRGCLLVLCLSPQLSGEQDAAQEGSPAPSAARRSGGVWRETPQICKFRVRLGSGSSCRIDLSCASGPGVLPFH